MGWGKRLSAVTAVMLIGSGATAQPAGAPSFVPVSIGDARNSARTVVVQPGDHLWKISQSHLDEVMGRPAEPVEVDPYWRSVIEVNRDQIRSGNPDLLYPGEVITLPAAG